MLRSLIADSKAAEHNVTTFLDKRLTAINPPNKADKIIAIATQNEFYKKLIKISKLVDGVYVIAPESDQLLENIVKTLEKSGRTSLNCASEAIKRVSNKMSTYEILKNNAIPVPETILLNNTEEPDSIKNKMKKLGFPLVVKPLDGVSCAGISIVKTQNHISKAVAKVIQQTGKEQFIVQKQVKGNAVSVCVFCDGKNAVSITLNQQFVTLSTPEKNSAYCGGTVPFNHPIEHEALAIAKKAVETLGGLKGYVGVDMVLTEKGPVVMEINPRLTVSYVGLRKVVNFNTAQAIIHAVANGKLPKNVQTTGYAFFSKLEMPTRSQNKRETQNMKEIVSPLFSIEENSPAHALVVTYSSSSNGAKSAFYRTKKLMLNNFEGD